MNSLMLLFSAATAAATPVSASPPAVLSVPVKHDVQCFMLYAVAVQRAVAGNDDKVKEAAGLGVMYFFTKLKIEAASLDLFETIRQEAARIGGDPQLKDVASACDAEFQQQGAELRDLGERLKQAAHQPSPSS